MKITVSPNDTPAPSYNAGDSIPTGIYSDDDGDTVIVSDHSSIMFLIIEGRLYGSGSIEWPIMPAPAGTKVELIA